jgi:hypothetical protein
MTKPVWRELAAAVPIEARPTTLWTMVLECVPPKRRLRLSVLPALSKAVPQWHLSHTETISPDGLPHRPVPQGKSLLLASAPRGALIAKIGGSSADVPDASVTAGTNPWPHAKVFAVGVYCVVTLASTDAGGPLFLTMNDTLEGFKDHLGSLKVKIEESDL